MIRTRAALAAVLALGFLAVPVIEAPSRAEAPIQPGARMTSPAGCTLNFVFRDASHTYIGTAGHCVDHLGQEVRTPDGRIGLVAFHVLEDADDFALIRLDRQVLGRVRPNALGGAGPTGVASGAETAVGDVVRLYGYGMVYGSSEATRPRSGILLSDDSEQWRAALPAIFGDSGGPVLHSRSGTALGIISGIGFDQTRPHTVLGTTVERALELVAEAGLPVKLATAP